MDKIPKMPTSEEFDKLCDSYITTAFTCGPCDHEVMEAAVNSIYEVSGLKKPKEFKWVDSPFIALTLLDNKLLKSSVLEKLWRPNVSGLSTEILSGVANASSIESSVNTGLSRVQTITWTAVGRTIQTVDDNSGYFAYGQHDVDVVNTPSTLVAMGYPISDEKKKWLDAMNVLTGTGWWAPFENIVIMVERTSTVNLDPQNRLHNTSGASVSWPNGDGVYYVHGVGVEKWIVEAPETITVKLVMDERNAEVRRIMCEQMGWDKYIIDAKLKSIDECDDPGNPGNRVKLYEAPAEIMGGRTRLLLVVNATPKLDGSIPRYALPVPANISSALEGVAWTFDVSPDVYKKLQRAT